MEGLAETGIALIDASLSVLPQMIGFKLTKRLTAPAGESSGRPSTIASSTSAGDEVTVVIRFWIVADISSPPASASSTPPG
ncbi:hypothetical protein [Kribbella sp. NPDC023855]|uniref:hypothetical protein n=1 Tax=Kribbella sp. NPDC023855 TaxID=3154698 RepID=UPI0033E8C396